MLEGVDIVISEDLTKPAAISSYTPYECPHPLADPTNSYDCDYTKYGTGGYGSITNERSSATLNGSGTVTLGGSGTITIQ